MARILSIEDDGDLQQLLAMQLRSGGYEVHYAFTGPEGVEKALLLEPDIILLDMMLPLMNGAQVLEKLRENPKTKNTPVVIVTAFFKNIPFLEKKIRKLGIVEYLRKPIRVDELKALLNRLVSPQAPSPAPIPRITRGSLALDELSRTVWLKERLVATLPLKRFALLRALVAGDAPVAREELIASVWRGRAGRNTLEKTVERLRRDLAHIRGVSIQTTEHGYAFVSAFLAKAGSGGKKNFSSALGIF